MLSINESLLILDLSFNNISAIGCKYICEGLKKNKKL